MAELSQDPEGAPRKRRYTFYLVGSAVAAAGITLGTMPVFREMTPILVAKGNRAGRGDDSGRGALRIGLTLAKDSARPALTGADDAPLPSWCASCEGIGRIIPIGCECRDFARVERASRNQFHNLRQSRSGM